MMTLAPEIFNATTISEDVFLEGSLMTAAHQQQEDSGLAPSFGNKLLGLSVCIFVLGIGFLLSHQYVVGEREELAQAERNRIEAEKQEVRNKESYRRTLAGVIESYAIRLTNNIASRSSSILSASRHTKNDNSDRELPNGSQDQQDCLSDTISIVSSRQDMDDLESGSDSDHDQEAHDRVPRQAACPTARSCIKEVIANNPCAICLEPFVAGDTIVCCSNNMVDGQKPHVFHQACALDYLYSHTDGVNAPCPCCRKQLLVSEEQRNACVEEQNPRCTVVETGAGAVGDIDDGDALSESSESTPRSDASGVESSIDDEVSECPPATTKRITN
mmetsp:Transcript_27735/g.59282  ORF Transcript_27735/g.59282 Transcript_27735/m.59282 type:complete len:331 (-) Transcript_27735:138-1130(-)